ncbi:hypothetical protein HHK36_018559 [Tetracentron sinense]|uniref:CBM20 domain-containing protein n=1 Tax=Tetracentron sinense TaxID=13715 RepID=A0A834YW69_TETSI|nr:hypothetical protein HHK36_018559 [Tetracentron sinense]
MSWSVAAMVEFQDYAIYLSEILRSGSIKEKHHLDDGLGFLNQPHVPEAKDNLENSEAHIQAMPKFFLQKECLFGEQFLLVGDGPIFGLWDPESAIPLEWSDVNVRTVELDVAIGKSIQFKFIHKGTAGEILWQPGPDRILQTWETKSTIIVSEDWENAEVQKITEESMANQND